MTETTGLNRVEKFFIFEKVKIDLLELYEKVLKPLEEDDDYELTKAEYKKVKSSLSLNRDIFKKLKAELNV